MGLGFQWPWLAQHWQAGTPCHWNQCNGNAPILHQSDKTPIIQNDSIGRVAAQKSGPLYPSVQRYCGGGSVPFWLPYTGLKNKNSSSAGQFSLTHYGDASQLKILGMWGPKQPKYSANFGESPFCVLAKLRDDANASWTTTGCDKTKAGIEK